MIRDRVIPGTGTDADTAFVTAGVASATVIGDADTTAAADTASDDALDNRLWPRVGLVRGTQSRELCLNLQL